MASQIAPAAAAGFLKKELARSAERPTMQEWLERVRQRKPIRARIAPEQVIRDLEDSG